MTELREAERIKKYFQNRAIMRRKFGAYYPLVYDYYKAVVDDVPEYADDILERLLDIKVHHRELNENGVLGRTTHPPWYDEVNCSVELEKISLSEMPLLNNSKETKVISLEESLTLHSLEYKNTEHARICDKFFMKHTFIHELTHSIVGAVMFEDNDSFTDVEPASVICVRWGVASSEYYTNEIKRENFMAKDPNEIYLEEGIVEDWAQDISTKLGLKNNLTDDLPLEAIISYPTFTMLCGMWNAVSQNRLRREFVWGESFDDDLGRKTQEFRALLLSLIKECQPEHNIHRNGAVDVDCKAIVALTKQTIDFCDKQRQTCSVGEVDEKYDTYKSYLLTGLPIAQFFKDKPELQENGENEIIYDKIFDAFHENIIKNDLEFTL